MHTTGMDTAQLIKNCIKGEQAAMHQLYRAYADAMLAVCYRYTKSQEDAEDVLQEGFIKVFTNLKAYKGSGELGAWIRRIMVNTALSYLRRHSRYKRQQGDIELLPIHPETEETPEVTLNAKELADMIRQMPVMYQTIFNLVAVEGYAQSEVAVMLDINENTVRSQYSRARAMMMRQLKKTEFNNNQSKPYAGNL